MPQDDEPAERVSFNPFNGEGPPPKLQRKSRVVARYTYEPNNGSRLRVLRWEPGFNGERKSFSQQHWDGTKWVNGGVDDPVLYHLPELIAGIAAGRPVWLAEGEKDVHTLEKLGEVATTMPGGAKTGRLNWRRSYTELLRGAAEVRLVHDNDVGKDKNTGAIHARGVWEALRGLVDVKVFRAATGKDLTDHIEAGHILAELVPVPPSSLPAAPTAKPAPQKPASPVVGATALQKVLGALVAVQPATMPHPPSQAGGDWTICCPLHDDGSPSATLRVGTDRPLIFICHRGCEPEAFFQWCHDHGITNADLMDTDTNGPDGGPLVRSLEGVTVKSVRWLWANTIAYGKVTNFEGDPEHGKSLVTLSFVATATSGGLMPDGARVELAAGLFIAAEDDYEDTVVPRLMATGADLSVCFQLTPKRGSDGRTEPFTLPDDNARLEGAIAEVKAMTGRSNVIVVVDPVSAYLSERINSNNDASVRKAISPLAELAKETGVAFWLVRHLNKNSGESNVAYRGGGSIGFFAAARAVFVFGRSKETPGQFIMAQSKNNLGTKQQSLTYHIETEVVGNGIETPRIEWDGTSEVTADSLLTKADAREAAPQRQEAARLLAEVFDGVDELPVEQVKKELKSLGISDSTVQRAAKEMGLVTERVRDEHGRTLHWKWRKPITSDGRIHVRSNGTDRGAP